MISVDGTVYAQLPFTTVVLAWSTPRSSGSATPARCSTRTPASPSCSPRRRSAKLGEEKRVGGEVVREVTATIPGDLVEQILTSKDPSTPVDARFSIATDRPASCAGPS